MQWASQLNSRVRQHARNEPVNLGRSLNCKNARSMQRSGCLASSECRHGPRSFSSSTSPQKQMKAILATSPTGSYLSTVARKRRQQRTNRAQRSDAVQIATGRVHPVWSPTVCAGAAHRSVTTASRSVEQYCDGCHVKVMAHLSC